jgi:hypothetical protein
LHVSRYQDRLPACWLAKQATAARGRARVHTAVHSYLLTQHVSPFACTHNIFPMPQLYLPPPHISSPPSQEAKRLVLGPTADGSIRSCPTNINPNWWVGEGAVCWGPGGDGSMGRGQPGDRGGGGQWASWQSVCPITTLPYTQTHTPAPPTHTHLNHCPQPLPPLPVCCPLPPPLHSLLLTIQCVHRLHQ